MLYSEKVSKEFTQKVKAISKDLGINPSWLMQLMYFETARTFSPSIQNPTTGATGLIQFMPSTARGLGTTTTALKQMSDVEQLDWVKKYLRQYPVDEAKTFGDLYLAVFYPLALSKDNDFVLGSQNGTAATVARQNPIFDTNKNGFLTKKEVVNYQNNEAAKVGLGAGIAARFDTSLLIWIAVLLAVVGIAYYSFLKFR